MEKKMKKIIFAMLVGVLFVGCNSSSINEQNIEPKLVVDKSVDGLVLKDQFEKEHTIQKDTYRLVFAFSKDAAHTCNDFFNAQKPTYLEEHHTQFIADVSAAPSIIRSLFILPGLKDFKHTVLLLDNKELAAPFRKDMNAEKVIIVYIINKRITQIRELTTAEELRKALEDDSPMSFIAPMLNQAIGTSKEMLDTVSK
jgi:hypothetical protein